MPDVLIYSTTHCPYCLRAKQLLEKRGVVYREIKVDADQKQLNIMMERSKRRTVPQIFIDEHHVGGYDDLAELDACGDLDNLLAGAKT